jgi:3-oxoadipate enol-lactonase
MQTLQVPTALGRIHLHLTGQGPTMLCWPSLLMTGMLWKAQAAAFGSAYRMVLVDPPGHGGSEALSRCFTLEECALCVTQILDALAVDECVLLGNSWGGMLGGVFAALYPSRTSAAVLMNCTASAASVRQKVEYTGLVALMRRLPKIPDAMKANAVKAFAGRTTEQNKPTVIAEIRAALDAVDARSASWAVESVVPRRSDHHDLLRSIRRPVLVIAGEEDRTFSVAETRAMADAIPGCQLEVLPKVGHLAALEAPDQVNASIRRFLGGLTGHTEARF